MDGSRFDRLARSLATGATSRRRLVRGIAALAGAGFAARFGLDETAARCARAGESCNASQLCCSGSVCTNGRCVCSPGYVNCNRRCVNLQTDREDCGACGNDCDDGFRCTGGRCVPTCTPQSPAVTCGGRVCGTATNNCGQPVSCGTCRSDQVCQSGACVCPPATIDCGGVCANTATNPNHCGACGVRCPSGTCVGGVCAVPETCNGRDDDLDGAIDEGRVCPANKICVAGACQCPPQTADCNGDTFCEPLGTDSHCAGCGDVCTGGKRCLNGGCACPAGTFDCGGFCIPDGECCGETCPCPPDQRECNGGCIPRAGCCEEAEEPECPSTAPYCLGNVCQPCPSGEYHCFTFVGGIVLCCPDGWICNAGCAHGSCAGRCLPPA